MTSVSGSAVVQAPPETVWALVADVTRLGEWNPEFVRCEWTGGATGPEVGATFRGHAKRGIASWTATCRVTECEPGRVFAFVVGAADDPTDTWRYSFVPATDGTMVTGTCEVGSPSGVGGKLRTLATTAGRDLQGGIDEGLTKLQVAARAATLTD